MALSDDRWRDDPLVWKSRTGTSYLQPNMARTSIYGVAQDIEVWGGGVVRTDHPPDFGGSANCLTSYDIESLIREGLSTPNEVANTYLWSQDT